MEKEYSLIRFERFFTQTSGCWVWEGGKNPKGYGIFYFKGKGMLAHRFSYSSYVGELAAEVCIRHSCDNPSCVNPKHLEPGTRADNVKDMYDREREFRKVGKEKFPVILKLVRAGVSKVKIADRLGVSKTCIIDICKAYEEP